MSTARKIFIAQLPWTVGTQELREYCKKYGRINLCEVIFDYKTGFSKGYGFVTFQNEDVAEKFLGKSHKIDGSQVYARNSTH